MKKRILIVIEDVELDGLPHFSMSLAGDKERLGEVPLEELGPAELWTLNVYDQCMNMFREQAEVVGASTIQERTVH